MNAKRASALSLSVLLLMALLVASPSPAQAACTSDQLVPRFHDVTVNQGLESYGVLVRGKQTVVRFYLSQPSCWVSTQTLQVKSATLTVNAGGVTTQVPADNLSTPGTLVQFTQAPAPNGPGDPIFIVPGSALDPPGTQNAETTFSLA